MFRSQRHCLSANAEAAMVDPLLTKNNNNSYKDAATVATSINSDDERNFSSSIDGSGDVIVTNNKPSTLQVLKSTFAILVAVASAVASILSFMIAPEVIVYVAGSICLMNFPMVAYKEKRILLLPSRRKTVKQLEESAELLRAEADELEDEIEYLLGYITRYGDVERELQEMAAEQGTSSSALVELVRINEETMEMMRENLRQKVIQDVIGIVIRNEKQHQIIDRVDAKLLSLKISVKLESYGVTFDENKFLQAVALNPTLWGVAGTIRKLLPPRVDNEEGLSIDGDVSVLSDANDIYDMFYMNAGGSTPEGRHASLATRRHPTALESRQRFLEERQHRR